MRLLPQMLPAGPLRRRLNQLSATLSVDLDCLRTTRAVLYTHRGQDVLRLTPKPRSLVPNAPRVHSSMTTPNIHEALLAAASGEPVILTRHGVVVALLTPLLLPLLED